MNQMLLNWLNRYCSRPEAVALLTIMFGGVIAFKQLGNIMLPICLSIGIAYLLTVWAKFLTRFHCPLKVARWVVFLLFVCGGIIGLLGLVPFLWNQFAELAVEIPAVLSNSSEIASKVHAHFPELCSVEHVQQLIVWLRDYLVSLRHEVVSFSIASIFSVVTAMVYLVLVPLLIFFLLRDSNKIIAWFAGFLPQQKTVLVALGEKVLNKINRYIYGKLIEILVVAAVSIIAFSLLRLRYAVLFGALAGVSVIIPYLGVVLITLPLFLIGMMQWGLSEHFGYLVLVHSVITIIDAQVLVPLLFSELMQLHPLAIILAILIFGNLFGFWGIFCAIPLMTILNLLINSWPQAESE